MWEGDTGVFLADLGGGWSLSVQIFSPLYSPQFEIFNNTDTFEPYFKRTEGGNLVFFDIHHPNLNYEIAGVYPFFDQSLEFNTTIDKDYLPIGIFAKSVSNFINYDDYFSIDSIQIRFVQDGITETFTNNSDRNLNIVSTIPSNLFHDITVEEFREMQINQILK